MSEKEEELSGVNETSEKEEDMEAPQVSYGLMSRIIGIFIEPSKAFKHISEKPEIWGALLFVFFVLLVSSLFTMNTMVDLNVQSASQMMSDQGMPSETIEKVTAFTAISTRFQSVISTITILIGWLLFALLVYIVGLIMGQESAYKTSWAVVAYSSLPGVLIKQGIIITILLMSREWASLTDFQQATFRSTLSLYTLFGNQDLNPYLQGLLISIDPFLIWSMVLMAIGLKFANRTKMSHAWITTIICNVIFLAATVPMVGMGIARMNAAG